MYDFRCRNFCCRIESAMDSPETPSIAKPRRSAKWLWLLVILLVVASALPIVHYVRAQQAPPTAAPQQSAQTANGVSCLGRVEPEGGVLHIAGRYISGRPPVVETLHVQEGQQVKTGTLLATLSGRAQQAAAVESAKEQIEVARRRLDQVKTSTVRKPDLAAQQAEISRLEATLKNQQAELQRYENLRKTDDVTPSELDARRTAVLTSQHAIDEARQRLASLNEPVRDADIKVAEAQLQAAVVDAEHAQREYELTAIGWTGAEDSRPPGRRSRTAWTDRDGTNQQDVRCRRSLRDRYLTRSQRTARHHFRRPRGSGIDRYGGARGNARRGAFGGAE